MLKDITKVKPKKDFFVYLEFEDGVSGEIDIRSLVEFTGVFQPLEDEAFFSKVAVNPEWGTIFWPNGADLDPDVLYSKITGEVIQEQKSIAG